MCVTREFTGYTNELGINPKPEVRRAKHSEPFLGALGVTGLGGFPEVGDPASTSILMLLKACGKLPPTTQLQTDLYDSRLEVFCLC